MMKQPIHLLMLCVLVVLMSGCASSTLYHWEHYDDDMYAYYKNPVNREKFTEELQEIIRESEVEGRIPPGIYAEYGYLLYEEKHYEEAITYFNKEKNVWPEATVFMDKMIRNAEKAAQMQSDKLDAKNTTP